MQESENLSLGILLEALGRVLPDAPKKGSSNETAVPSQFQKQLRLQEARRLMLAERMDAANAAFQVGYESPSQFSREYNRMFGAPPLRDITKLRQMAVAE